MTTYNPEPKEIDINSSAAELRNYTLAFVSFLLYVLITATSTTHEQLLRISAVKLPLLDIDIPIVQFYLVSPLLILILHFHLLLQHFLFSQQFYSFDAALQLQYPDRIDRVRFMKSLSGNLSLVHLLGGYQKTTVQMLLAAILAICLLVFPLFDLWFLQARFLPFHDNDYTNWQCLLVVIDCVMSVVLLPKVLDKNDDSLAWWLGIVPAFIKIIFCQSIKKSYLTLLRRYYHLYYQYVTLKLAKILPWNEKVVIKRKLLKLQCQYHAPIRIKNTSFKQIIASIGLFSFVAMMFILSVFVSTLPQFEYEEDNLFVNDREKWLLQNVNECEYSSHDYLAPFLSLTIFCKVNNDLFSLTNLLHGEYYIESRFLSRNLDLSEKIITADEHLSRELENNLDKESSLEKIAGIDLRGRDLRYANFDHAKLPKADLRTANLQNASLSNVNLQESNLQSTQLQGAVLAFAQLQRSNLEYANLNRTNLNWAKLQGVYLESVSLQNSFLKTHLEGTKISLSLLEGSDLRFADLQGVYLRKDNDKYITPKFKNLPIDESKWDIPCLTDDEKLPFCKKYNSADKETLNKITAYWINDLACSDKWVAQVIMKNYLFNTENAAKFKTYLIPLLNKKLTDKNCLGIQNLPDDFKQQIKDAIKKP